FKKGKSPRNDNLFSIKNGRAQHKTTRYMQITSLSTTTITHGDAKKTSKTPLNFGRRAFSLWTQSE
ncbi:hypothetical protein NL369_27290, partial [Klebsiella pneumoniae]|nr:hypothetical protein [Klebsiella pneumoniae]